MLLLLFLFIIIITIIITITVVVVVVVIIILIIIIFYYYYFIIYRHPETKQGTLMKENEVKLKGLVNNYTFKQWGNLHDDAIMLLI